MESKDVGHRGFPMKALAVGLIVVAIVGAFAYLQLVNIYNGSSNGSLSIDWRLKLTYFDGIQKVNYTLPANIGTPGGLWSNHTLDSIGPTGYSPLSTRDTSSTIWIQSTQPGVFTFGDFFNVWGQAFSVSCVGVPNGGPYCTRAADAIVYSANNHTSFSSGDTQLPVFSYVTIPTVTTGTLLKRDPALRFFDPDSDGVYNQMNDTVIWDPNGGNTYNPALDFKEVPPSSSAATNATAGVPLSVDTRLKFVDTNGDGQWERTVPPPVLSDATCAATAQSCERCLGRGYLLSDNKQWIIILWSSLAIDENLPNACLS